MFPKKGKVFPDAGNDARHSALNVCSSSHSGRAVTGGRRATPDPKRESPICLFGSVWLCQPSLSWSRNHPKPDIAQGDHRLAGRQSCWCGRLPAIMDDFFKRPVKRARRRFGADQQRQRWSDGNRLHHAVDPLRGSFHAGKDNRHIGIVAPR